MEIIEEKEKNGLSFNIHPRNESIFERNENSNIACIPMNNDITPPIIINYSDNKKNY